LQPALPAIDFQFKGRRGRMQRQRFAALTHAAKKSLKKTTQQCDVRSSLTQAAQRNYNLLISDFSFTDISSLRLKDMPLDVCLKKKKKKKRRWH
jgi:type II secretory pathway component HofQ